MDAKLKCKILFSILSLSPATTSMTAFADYANAGDVDAFWRYYQNALRHRQERGQSVEQSGGISFEALQPAMDAVYSL